MVWPLAALDAEAVRAGLPTCHGHAAEHMLHRGRTKDTSGNAVLRTSNTLMTSVILGYLGMDLQQHLKLITSYYLSSAETFGTPRLQTEIIMAVAPATTVALRVLVGIIAILGKLPLFF